MMPTSIANTSSHQRTGGRHQIIECCDRDVPALQGDEAAGQKIADRAQQDRELEAPGGRRVEEIARDDLVGRDRDRCQVEVAEPLAEQAVERIDRAHGGRTPARRRPRPAPPAAQSRPIFFMNAMFAS